ncbi:MAG: hypothetical protein MRERV_68c011 [Mycoplasmataceae bacterium RV_VA103A]|nr:MAG: hypothetical protein MRERV_68c011 [Mycoplasmataceae bacterium RV_VA103A]
MLHEKHGVECSASSCINFSKFFEGFWGGELGNEVVMDYSLYGSDLKISGDYKKLEKEIEKVASPPDFYQQVPFLTIAEDLLKLIKEDKIEKLIFLSTGDKRKFGVFWKTFRKFHGFKNKKRLDDDVKRHDIEIAFFIPTIELKLMSEERKHPPYPQTKADWIKQNASDYDLVIDDNPNICKSIIKAREEDDADWDRHADECMGCSDCHSPDVLFANMKVIAPYYPATANQHDERVLLAKNEVSSLKKEDFK